MNTERRSDPFTGRCVLVAPGRRGLGGARPSGLPEPSDRRCPFCPGHEADTELTVARWPDAGPWRVRVVDNKYPVVAPTYGSASGRHEVVIESRDHDADLAEFSIQHLAGLLGIWRARVRALEAEPSLRAVLLFRNRGRRAGSSQPHPHAQIAGTSWVPSEVALRWKLAIEHHASTGESLHAAELRRELDGPRLLRADAHLASFCPHAPSRPFEVRFAPRHAHAFAETEDATLGALAAHLSEAARRLRRATTVVDYNLVLRLPPARERGSAAAWHLDLLPRTGGDAGFELAGGEMVVVVSPEQSAEALRNADIGQPAPGAPAARGAGDKTRNSR